MKKNVLALSITAALVGFAGGAQATAGAASDLALSPGGVGHMLLVPYYSAQGGNVSMIDITNTDTANGKAVKVRFRGASNSDDVFDFQVFLSPGDVWTASVSQGADGRAQLNTSDNSCTKPNKATLNATPFVTGRLDSTLSVTALANQTREGYIEIFNMADIPSAATGLFTAIKHVSSVAPCAGTAWSALDADSVASLIPGDLTNPTTGLMANWIILNSTDAGAWSGQATAVYAYSTLGVPSTGNLVYWPQTGTSVGAAASSWTADPLLSRNTITAAYYDLPDMSTPYVSSAITPSQQAAKLSASIATANVINEYLTVTSFGASTDWTLSMPTRRYAVALTYGATAAAVYNSDNASFFAPTNTTVIARQICVPSLSYSIWDQEENVLNQSNGVVVSPSSPIPGVPFCGEAGVMSVNSSAAAASGTLKATVARSELSPVITNAIYTQGWIKILTPGATNAGMPVLGAAFLKASSANGRYGVTWDHRNTRYAPQ